MQGQTPPSVIKSVTEGSVVNISLHRPYALMVEYVAFSQEIDYVTIVRRFC